MKTKVVLVGLLCLWALSSPLIWAEKITKVGVVDLARVMSAFAKDSPAVKELADYWKETESQLEKLSAEIADLESKLQKAKDAKDERMALDLEKRLNDRRAYRSEYYNYRRAEYEKRYNELSKASTIFQQIQRIIEYIAIKESYSLILLKTDPAIVYFSKDVDITEDVIEYLSK